MTFSSWLQSVCARCIGRESCSHRSLALQSRAAGRTVGSGESSYVEGVESRLVLSVSALFASGTLDIVADGADTVIVRANAGGQVEVLDQNGLLATAPA